MSFNSFYFYPYLAAVLMINYLLPLRKRWIWLLISSYLFYYFIDLRYVYILLACTVSAFLAGRLIEKAQQEKWKKIWLFIGIGINLALLFVFKYFNFVLQSLNELFTALNAGTKFNTTNLFFPVGISFFTLQTIGYLLDVKHQKIAAENNLGQFALFVSFFPKLLIGPIERYDHLRSQFINPEPFQFERVKLNLLRIGWGILKKLVIADRLAVISSTVFAAPENFESTKLVIAVIAFSFRIYIDFSSYSDIAIGTANILGIHMVENFDKPYLARTVIDFWRRWHISFSNWLRDYIFLPLNYRTRKNQPRELWTIINVMITFTLSGFWHGANWTFIIWGMLHGFYQSVEILLQRQRVLQDKTRSKERATFTHLAFQTILTFCLVSFGWIFFQAATIGEAADIIRPIVTLKGISSESAWLFNDASLGLDRQDLLLAVHSSMIFFIAEILQQKFDLLKCLFTQPRWFRWTIYLSLIFSIVIFGYYGNVTAVDFVYRQF